MIYLSRKLIETAPLIHRAASPRSLVKRFKYCIRGLIFARCTREWFEMLQAPEMSLIAGNHPYLFHKLQRPYLCKTLSTHERLEALKHHYRFVTDHFAKRTMEDVYASRGKLLAEVSAGKSGIFEIFMSCSRMEKEGDISIKLVNKESGNPVNSLSFSIWKPGEIFIGGLQGHKSADKDLVIAITKGLHGLRPKALLVYVLQQLAMGWDIGRLRAVSDDLHIYRHFQKRRNLAASYDEFWIENGGTLAPDGNFDLAAAFVPREISAIRINKRPMYRRRYAMLADIESQIKNQMSQKKPGHFATAGIDA